MRSRAASLESPEFETTGDEFIGFAAIDDKFSVVSENSASGPTEVSIIAKIIASLTLAFFSFAMASVLVSHRHADRLIFATIKASPIPIRTSSIILEFVRVSFWDWAFNGVISNTTEHVIIQKTKTFERVCFIPNHSSFDGYFFSKVALKEKALCAKAECGSFANTFFQGCLN